MSGGPSPQAVVDATKRRGGKTTCLGFLVFLGLVLLVLVADWIGGPSAGYSIWLVITVLMGIGCCIGFGLEMKAATEKKPRYTKLEPISTGPPRKLKKVWTEPCEFCLGQKVVNDLPCPVCNGTGYKYKYV